METRANHLVVGAFVLAVVAGLFVFAVWLGKGEIAREVDRYYIYFTGSVSGLSVTSKVLYRGVPVGSVADIRIDPENSERVRVLVEVARGTPVKTDAVAALELQGVTGLVNVEISGGARNAPLLRPEPGRRYAVIPSEPSRLEALLRDLPALVLDIKQLVERANGLFTEKNVAAIEATLNNVARLTGALAQSGGDIQALTGDAAIAAAELRRAAEALTVFISDAEARLPPLTDKAGAALDAATATAERMGTSVEGLSRSGAAALGRIGKSADAVTAAATKLQGLVDDNRLALKDFSNEGLYEFTRFLVEARALVNNLNRISERFESNPAGFLFGDSEAGYKPK